MDDIRMVKPTEAWKIKHLVEERPHITVVTEPAKPPGKTGIDGNECHLVTLTEKVLNQGTGLNPLSPQDIETGRDDRNPRTPLKKRPGDIHFKIAT
jgi:hypothetical protein